MVTIKTFTQAGIEARLSDKGAVVIYNNGRWSHNLPPKAVKMHAELGCPFFTAIAESPEFSQVQENKLINRERENITKQINKQLEKAKQYQQAAIDKLVASGMTPDQAKKFLNVA